jgi:hypothetical protein
MNVRHQSSAIAAELELINRTATELQLINRTATFRLKPSLQRLKHRHGHVSDADADDCNASSIVMASTQWTTAAAGWP